MNRSFVHDTISASDLRLSIRSFHVVRVYIARYFCSLSAPTSRNAIGIRGYRYPAVCSVQVFTREGEEGREGVGERRKKELPFASRSVEWQSMTRRTEANRHGIVVEEDFSNVAATGLQGRGGVLPPDVDAFPPSASREIPTLLLPRPRIELPDLLRVPVSQSRDRQPWDVSPPFRRSSVLQIDPERPMRNRTVNPLGSSLSLSHPAEDVRSTWRGRYNHSLDLKSTWKLSSRR